MRKTNTVNIVEDYSKELLLNIINNHIEESLREGVENDFNVTNISLFGSRISGDFNDDSDLDVLIEYEGNYREDDIFNALNGFPLEVNNIKLDFSPYSIERGNSLDSNSHLLGEVKTLYSKNEEGKIINRDCFTIKNIPANDFDKIKERLDSVALRKNNTSWGYIEDLTELNMYELEVILREELGYEDAEVFMLESNPAYDDKVLLFHRYNNHFTTLTEDNFEVVKVEENAKDEKILEIEDVKIVGFYSDSEMVDCFVVVENHHKVDGVFYEIYSPIGEHATMWNLDYLKKDSISEITLNEYINKTKGLYTPEAYLKESDDKEIGQNFTMSKSNERER